MTGVAYAALIIAGTALVGLITFAVLAVRRGDRIEAARVLATSTAGELKRANEKIERLTKELSDEKERSDALDDELAKTYDVPNPVGARDRVLANWKLKHDAARGRAIRLPAPSAADNPGPDGLLNPFE